MEPQVRPIRSLPLKIAGVIGVLSAVMYLYVTLGTDSGSIGAEAFLWLIVLTAAGLLALFADRVQGRERALAIASASLFFLLAMFASPVFVLVYLFSAILALAGLWGTRTEPGTSVEA
ncbi:MAG: hypothetical protein WBM90_04070 [Acidimicrobiia bacterium]